MDENKMTQQEESREREALVVLYVLGAAIVAVVLWIAHARLFLTNQQLIELSAFPLLAIAFAISVLRLLCNPPVAPRRAMAANRSSDCAQCGPETSCRGSRQGRCPGWTPDEWISVLLGKPPSLDAGHLLRPDRCGKVNAVGVSLPNRISPAAVRSLSWMAKANRSFSKASCRPYARLEECTSFA